jgi:hypothetical protein
LEREKTPVVLKTETTGTTAETTATRIGTRNVIFSKIFYSKKCKKSCFFISSKNVFIVDIVEGEC